MIPLTTSFFRFVALVLSAVYTLGLPLAGFWSPVIYGPSLEGRVTVTAHSGCLHLEDNSISAMAAGYAAGAEIVEFDLNFRQDGTPALDVGALFIDSNLRHYKIGAQD